MSKEDKKMDQAKAQAAPGYMPGSGMSPYPGMPQPPYPQMPIIQPGCPPGMPGSQQGCAQGDQLAQGYFPIQCCGSPQYELTQAFCAGTLWPELSRPYPR